MDAGIHSENCAAVCCRMTVLLMPGYAPPARYITEDRHGMMSMAKADDGWCAELDRHRMCCSIYPQRPMICREFAMGGEDCQIARAHRARDFSIATTPEERRRGEVWVSTLRICGAG